MEPDTTKNHEAQGMEAALRAILHRAAMRRKYTLATRLALEQCPHLREIARDLDIKGRSRMDKTTLISSICAHVVDRGARIDLDL